VIRIGSITQTIHYTQRAKALSSVVNEGLPPLPKDELWQTRAEETQLRQWLATQQLRVIGLEGAGGYGKSATAAKVVQTLATASDSGLERQPLWVNFQEPIAFGTFARWVIRKLVGEVAYDQRRETYEQLDDAALVQESLNHLTQHPCALVMDNLETLFQSEALWQPYGEFLDGWLGRSGEGCLLLTSQYRLELPSANTWTWLPLRGLDRAQGVALLQGEGVIGEQADLEAFVEAADGHPLLLTLAVNLLKRQEKEDFEQPEILRLGRSGVELLRGIVESHRGDSEASVGKVLDASFERLHPAWLRVLLWRLSVVRQGFGLGMAQAMVDETVELQQLRYLARWSFVQEAKPDGEWRFDFLPLIARYLQLGAEEHVQTTIAHEQAITFYTRHYQPWDGTLASCREPLEAFYHACELGQYQRAYDLLDRCFDQLDRAGHWRSLLPLYEHLTTAWQPADDSEAQNLGWAWTRLGNFQQNLGDYPGAVTAHQQAYNDFTNLKYLEGQAAALGNLGAVYNSLCTYSQAITYQQESLEISRAIGSKYGEAGSLSNLGSVYHNLDNYKLAITYHQEALDISKEIGDKRGEANCLGNLGNAYRFLGNYEQAITYYKQSLKILQTIGDKSGAATALSALGNAYGSLKNYEKATTYHQQSLAIECSINDKKGEAGSLNSLGNIYHSLGDYGQAITYHQQSLKILREIGHKQGEAASLNGLGNVYYSLGNYEQAIISHQQSLAIDQEIGNQRGQASSLTGLGSVYNTLGDYGKAIVAYQQSLEIRQVIGDSDGEGGSLCNLGNIFRSLGDYHKAIDLYHQALLIQRKVGNREFEANSLHGLGNVYDSLGDYRQAIDYHQQSLEIKRTIGDKRGEAESLSGLGNVYSSSGDYRQAITYYQQSLTTQKEIDDRSGVGNSLFNMALAQAKLDDHGQALLNFQQAKAIYADLKLDHRIEQCNQAIRQCHQIIPAQHRLAPSIGNEPKPESLSSWYEQERQANQRKTHTAQTRAGNQPFYLWVAVALVVAMLVWWLKR
jgi:tetratricopeptide (TPR) repeat protein